MSAHTERDVLRMVGYLLEDENRRVTEASAQDGNGRKVNSDDPVACRWCLYFAISICAKALRVDACESIAVADKLLQESNGIIVAWDTCSTKSQDAMLAKLRAA